MATTRNRTSEAKEEPQSSSTNTESRGTMSRRSPRSPRANKSSRSSPSAVRGGTKTARRTAKNPGRSTRSRRGGTRKYGKKASDKVGEKVHEMKRGALRSGRSNKKVTSRKQAIAIGLSEARREGAKVPARKKKKKKSA